MEHANLASTIILGLITFAVLFNIFLAQKGKELFIRRIPGIEAIDEAVGRATEMGRPILFSVGLGGIDIVTLQAIEVIGHVARIAAKFRTRVIVPVVDPVVVTVLEDVLREAYASQGASEAFRPEDVRFLSGEQFAYAAGVVGIMNREQVATNFFFGTFMAEALILAESGQSVGAVQIAGTPSALQVPFFITTCDYTIIGEEYYATTAYISKNPVLMGSVVGQDWGKMAILLGIAAGLVGSLIPQRMFGLDLKYQRELDAGILQDDFRKEFAAHGIKLSPIAKVSTKHKGMGWDIKERTRTYNLAKEDNQLSIYWPAVRNFFTAPSFGGDTED